ncbi:class I SAM-dependent methyltransferase [Hyphomonas sp. WL0036]|uniref:class I SAM-dependent methyltransferase n=1 Tax=Hyphomonas sediminis TaxID=2866160 RepID=UPI001C7E2712|nr:class I SAM-dependent methyltransferase [Hyphomonas sediminis]MBY9065706.1 class I SAM-dependent methyltransferase [Hyphomonas sediminis]
MRRPASPASAPAPFDEAHAKVYDDQFAALNALKDCFHLLMEGYFSGLPEDARILVAGAGTGAEVRYLAPRHPGWRFTLVDPSAPMLAVARRHAEAGGYTDRCAFHADYVSATPLAAHDAATSLLVSHFLTDAVARQSYFADIAARLKSGGRLINVDLCADDTAHSFESVMSLWLSLMGLNGQSEDSRAHYRKAYGVQFAVHGPDAVAKMIEAGGFSPPAPVFQAALMRGWTAQKA